MATESPRVAHVGATLCDGQDKVQSRASRRRARCRKVAVRYDRKQSLQHLACADVERWKLPDLGRSNVARCANKDTQLVREILPHRSLPDGPVRAEDTGANAATDSDVVPREIVSLMLDVHKKEMDKLAEHMMGVHEKDQEKLAQRLRDDFSRHIDTLLAKIQVLKGDNARLEMLVARLEAEASKNRDKKNAKGRRSKSTIETVKEEEEEYAHGRCCEECYDEAMSYIDMG